MWNVWKTYTWKPKKFGSISSVSLQVSLPISIRRVSRKSLDNRSSVDSWKLELFKIAKCTGKMERRRFFWNWNHLNVGGIAIILSIFPVNMSIMERNHGDEKPLKRNLYPFPSEAYRDYDLKNYLLIRTIIFFQRSHHQYNFDMSKDLSLFVIHFFWF